MILKSIIIDDDIMARNALERLCLKNHNIELLGIFDDGESALKFLENTDPDLIFLDIEMPQLSGLELLNRLAYLPMIIFTTSSPEYAYDAFEFHAVDFLKKPISLVRFEQAVNKASDKLEKKRQAIRTMSDLSEEIYIKEEGRYVRIPCADILFFENVGDYIRVKTINGQHIIYGTLKSVDERLNDARFLKVHRTYIVNLSKIKDIEENSLVIDKTVIPISRANKAELMGRLRIL